MRGMRKERHAKGEACERRGMRKGRHAKGEACSERRARLSEARHAHPRHGGVVLPDRAQRRRLADQHGVCAVRTKGIMRRERDV